MLEISFKSLMSRNIKKLNYNVPSKFKIFDEIEIK